jgi:hypothetical protein
MRVAVKKLEAQRSPKLSPAFKSPPVARGQIGRKKFACDRGRQGHGCSDTRFVVEGTHVKLTDWLLLEDEQF